MSPLRTILITSHAMHYRHQGQLWAYGPYAREIDIWADIFPQVRIASPCRDEPPPGDCLPFTRPNIEIAPQVETGGARWGAKLRQLCYLPWISASLIRQMRRADAVHVRNPGNLGLLGALLAPLCCRHRVAKYAGQWNGYVGEPWTNRWQRMLLGSRWWNQPVTVYGDWPNQAAHVHSFFTSMMTRSQVAAAADAAATKQLAQPLRVLFAGRLAAEKRVPALLQAARTAVDSRVPLEVAVVGDGELRADLERQTADMGLEDIVRFEGAVPFDDVMRWYEWAHCLVLPSRHSEGWPKVVAEAMCHGVVCIAVDHGQLSAMLKGRGLLLPSGSGDEIAEAIGWIVAHPERYADLSAEASLWSREFSLDTLRQALIDLLEREWRTRLSVELRDSIPAEAAS